MSTYKYINIFCCVLVAVITLGIYQYLKIGYCIDSCSLELVSGILKPIYWGGLVLLPILIALLFIPVHIFRRWLFYVAPIILLLTINRVGSISVHSGSIGTIDRIHMAQYGMYLLAFITVIFVAGHLVYDWRKKKAVQK